MIDDVCEHVRMGANPDMVADFFFFLGGGGWKERHGASPMYAVTFAQVTFFFRDRIKKTSPIISSMTLLCIIIACKSARVS